MTSWLAVHREGERVDEFFKVDDDDKEKVDVAERETLILVGGGNSLLLLGRLMQIATNKDVPG